MSSAKVYLQNIRNLQKTERELFETKKLKNDQALQQGKTDIDIKDEKGLVANPDLQYAEKNTSSIEIEAETLNQRSLLQQRQLEIKDEGLIPEIIADRTKIQEIDNTLSKRTVIKDGIEAMTNCVRRGI